MKILQVVPRYAPAWAFGGPIRITYEVAKELVRRNHDVTVYTSDSLDLNHRVHFLQETIDGIKIKRFRNLSNYLSVRLAFLFYCPLGFARELKDRSGEFDIVHVVEARGPHNRWVAEHVPSVQRPFVWSAYGGLAEGQGSRRLYRWLHDRVFNTPALVQKAAGLIAQTEHEASVYRSFGGRSDRIRLIPLAVNWSEFAELPKRGELRRKLGLGENHKLVLFVGRIHKTKGLQLLIPAFADVRAKVPEARLVIVGWDQGFANSAIRLIRQHNLGDYVSLLPPVYGPDRISLYADADVFALTPGVYEETSLAALEACASGTPCLLTRQCEIPGLEEAGAGIITRYERNEVANSLIDLLGSGEIRRHRARELVFNRFTIDVITTQHEHLFEEICHGRN